MGRGKEEEYGHMEKEVVVHEEEHVEGAEEEEVMVLVEEDDQAGFYNTVFLMSQFKI